MIWFLKFGCCFNWFIFDTWLPLESWLVRYMAFVWPAHGYGFGYGYGLGYGYAHQHTRTPWPGKLGARGWLLGQRTGYSHRISTGWLAGWQAGWQLAASALDVLLTRRLNSNCDEAASWSFVRALSRFLLLSLAPRLFLARRTAGLVGLARLESSPAGPALKSNINFHLAKSAHDGESNS